MSHWQHCGQDCQTYHLNIVTVNLSIHKILLLDFCSPATACKVPGRCQFYQPYENDYKDDCDDVLSYDDDVADNDDDDDCCLVFKTPALQWTSIGPAPRPLLFFPACNFLSLFSSSASRQIFNCQKENLLMEVLRTMQQVNQKPDEIHV